MIPSNKTCLLHEKINQNNSSIQSYSYSSIVTNQNNIDNEENEDEKNKYFKLTYFSCCSMKMPTAARQAISFVTNLFGNASTSTAQVSSEINQQNGKIYKNNNNHQKIITEQPKTSISPAMPSTDSTSPTASSASSDISDESILNYEPTSYEKDLIKKTWSDDFDFLYELGAAIYIYIFDHNPNTKLLFPTIHRHGDKWKESKEFRSQALKFVQTLSHCVKNLYHMERLGAYLHKIGVLHVKYAKRGFKPEYWNMFLDAMEVSLADAIARNQELTEEQKADCVRVWRRLAHYVITQMKRGYNEKLHESSS